MPAADLYLLPSNSESFGLSALEAQACGVPVLGYAVGGLPEVIEHGETGFLRDVGDVAGLAEDGAALLLDERALRGDVPRLARARDPPLPRGRDRVALSRPVRARPRRRLTRGGGAVGQLGPGRAPRRGAPVLPRERRPEKAGIVRRERHPNAGEEHPAERVRLAARNGPRPEVRRRADVADDAALRERLQERRVLDRPDAVRDPHGLEKAQGVGDRIRPCPLARVDDREEASSPSPPIHLPEIACGEGRFVPAEAEADDAPPGPLGVEVEDARGGRRAPVPHEIEEDAHAPAAFSLVLLEDALERVDDVEPVESDLLHDGRRDRDLGPPDVLPREARHESPRDERIVGGAPKLPADVAVKAEEGLLRSESASRRARTAARSGKMGSSERDERRTRAAARDGSLEVQVKLHFRRGREPAEEGEGVSSGSHARASYERPFETGPVPLGTPPRERLWMRAAAFGVDLILVAGVPLLLASAIVFFVYASSREAPAGLDDGFRAAQAVALGLFLFRDAGGGSPGKKLFGLRLILAGGAKAGALESLLRNVPLLIPGWNLIELSSLLRRRDGRRPGDRLAGTLLVEA